MKETITLSSREIQRVQVLEQVCRGALTLVESTPLLLVCYRQAKRLLARYRQEGPAGLAHQRRGQPAHNVYGPEMRDRVMGLHQERYAKFNDTHLVQMLAEREEIRIGRETVSRDIEYLPSSVIENSPPCPFLRLFDLGLIREPEVEENP